MCERIEVMRPIESIIKTLREKHWYIGIMESCTGGAIINSITNIPGASDVFKLGKVTYSDEAKIETGVNEKTIKKYSVYSIKVAEEMARKIEGEIGIGVTGNLNFPRVVYIAVRIKDKVGSEKIEVKSLLKDKIEARKEMKGEVVDKVWEMVVEELG